MTFRPSYMLAITHLPCDERGQVKGNLTCVLFCDIPFRRSIPFPTATIMQSEVGGTP